MKTLIFKVLMASALFALVCSGGGNGYQEQDAPVSDAIAGGGVGVSFIQKVTEKAPIICAAKGGAIGAA